MPDQVGSQDVSEIRVFLCLGKRLERDDLGYFHCVVRANENYFANPRGFPCPAHEIIAFVEVEEFSSQVIPLYRTLQATKDRASVLSFISDFLDQHLIALCSERFIETMTDQGIDQDVADLLRGVLQRHSTLKHAGLRPAV